MLLGLSEQMQECLRHADQIRDCLRHAQDCARRARNQSCPKLRQQFLEMEVHWLKLARSFEFGEALADFPITSE